MKGLIECNIKSSSIQKEKTFVYRSNAAIVFQFHSFSDEIHKQSKIQIKFPIKLRKTSTSDSHLIEYNELEKIWLIFPSYYSFKNLSNFESKI